MMDSWFLSFPLFNMNKCNDHQSHPQSATSTVLKEMAEEFLHQTVKPKTDWETKKISTWTAITTKTRLWWTFKSQIEPGLDLVNTQVDKDNKREIYLRLEWTRTSQPVCSSCSNNYAKINQHSNLQSRCLDLVDLVNALPAAMNLRVAMQVWNSVLFPLLTKKLSKRVKILVWKWEIHPGL